MFNLIGNGFNPKYSYYKKENSIIIKLECPGNCKLQCEKKYQGEYVTGIPLKSQDFIIKHQRPIIERNHGIINRKII